MRVKTGIWVAAYVRRAHLEGAFAAVRRRGADEAGAVFIKITRLDGTADVFGPAPQTAFDEARPADRAFVGCLKVQPAPRNDELDLCGLVSILTRQNRTLKPVRTFVTVELPPPRRAPIDVDMIAFSLNA